MSVQTAKEHLFQDGPVASDTLGNECEKLRTKESLYIEISLNLHFSSRGCAYYREIHLKTVASCLGMPVHVGVDFSNLNVRITTGHKEIIGSSSPKDLVMVRHVNDGLSMLLNHDLDTACRTSV